MLGAEIFVPAGWQTSNTWAGTCRRFQLQLNDGSATLHTADFMFFS